MFFTKYWKSQINPYLIIKCVAKGIDTGAKSLPASAYGCLSAYDILSNRSVCSIYLYTCTWKLPSWTCCNSYSFIVLGIFCCPVFGKRGLYLSLILFSSLPSIFYWVYHAWPLTSLGCNYMVMKIYAYRATGNFLCWLALLENWLVNILLNF